MFQSEKYEKITTTIFEVIFFLLYFISLCFHTKNALFEKYHFLWPQVKKMLLLLFFLFFIFVLFSIKIPFERAFGSTAKIDWAVIKIEETRKVCAAINSFVTVFSKNVASRLHTMQIFFMPANVQKENNIGKCQVEKSQFLSVLTLTIRHYLRLMR
jgi:hypothetical protein